MRISLFLNSTMSKSCVQPQKKDWSYQEQKPYTHSLHGIKTPFTFEVSAKSDKKASSFPSRSTTGVNHSGHFPDLLNACYEIKWLFKSQTTLSQVLDTAVTQFGSLVLLAVTLLLLTAQVAGLAFILSSTASWPFGFQFMLASVFLISATAFKIMH